jgi:hypothetical protein
LLCKSVLDWMVINAKVRKRLGKSREKFLSRFLLVG